MIIYSKLINYINLKRKKVQYGKNFVVIGKIFVHGVRGRISFGDNCRVFSDQLINPTSGVNHSHFNIAKEGRIKIGNGVGMSHVNIVSWDNIEIEDNVFIGSGVKIWDTDFHSLEYTKRLKSPDPGVKHAPIKIKEGAFIGACAIVLKGVTIGKHSVIGAGSVVTKSVPDNEIWAGNPAQFIRKIEEQT